MRCAKLAALQAHHTWAKRPVVQGPKEAPRGRRGRRVRVVRACAHHALLSARVQDESPADRAPA
jgi:hypothetical protein